MNEQDEKFFTEDTVSSWSAWLDEFKSDILPLFAARGFSPDAALIAFQVNQVANAAARDDDEDEPWRQG